MIAPEVLEQRSNLLRSIRSFFYSRDYIEVDTPILLPELIPEAEIHPVTCQNQFLHTSPELCMKRLLATGCQRIFQICHCFRQEELGRLHLPEFTLLEWYRVGWDYFDIMAECEELICWVAEDRTVRRGTADTGWTRVANRRPWKKLSLEDAFARFADSSLQEAMRTDRFDEVLVTQIEPHLGIDTPVFLYDYPMEYGSLARRKEDNPTVAERFELYINTIELANGFSELVDPEEQKNRFMKECEKAGHPSGRIPFKLLDALHHLSSAAGIALGVDRLLMVLLGADSLEDVVPFSPADL